MSKQSNWQETVKKLVAEKQTLQAPNVTCGSGDERKWWPPYVVSAAQEKQGLPTLGPPPAPVGGGPARALPMTTPFDPPKAGEIWRPRHDAGRAAVVLRCEGGEVAYAWLDGAAGADGVAPLDDWRLEFEFVFEKQDHADATPARRGRLVDDFEGHFRGQRVLELGAHLGGLTRSIAQYAKSTTAVENNPRCVPALRASLPGSVEVVRDDMHRALWRLPPGAFDVIVCAGVLYHSAHPFLLLEGMARLAPARVLVDTLDGGVDGARAVPAPMTNSLNYRYNERPDCGFSIVLGGDIIERAMARLGYATASRVRKDDVPIAPERDSDYFRAWQKSYAAWFYRDA